jgi:hypothetical protein
MTGRAAMTGNVTKIRRATMTRNPITLVKVKVWDFIEQKFKRIELTLTGSVSGALSFRNQYNSYIKDDTCS